MHIIQQTDVNGSLCKPHKGWRITIATGPWPVPGKKIYQRGCPYGGYFSSTLPWPGQKRSSDPSFGSVVHSSSMMKKDGRRCSGGGDAKQNRPRIFCAYHFCKCSLFKFQSDFTELTSQVSGGLGNDHDILADICVSELPRIHFSQYGRIKEGYYYGRRPVSPLMPISEMFTKRKKISSVDTLFSGVRLETGTGGTMLRRFEKIAQ
jgi:hypothetical protein